MKAFAIHPEDNVATILEAVAPGEVSLLGASDSGSLVAIDKIAVGHKIALRDISEGEGVIKYGIRIGHTTKPVSAGQWVHLHNCGSDMDERSNTLDVETGAPTEVDIYR